MRQQTFSLACDMLGGCGSALAMDTKQHGRSSGWVVDGLEFGSALTAATDAVAAVVTAPRPCAKRV